MKEIIINNAKRLQAPKGVISFALASENQYILLQQLFDFQEKKRKAKSMYYRIRISPPFRGRTTGKKSQCNRINGFVRQIAMATGNDFDDVKIYCKQKAISRGYPLMKDHEGNIVYSINTGDPLPESESNISVEEAMILSETIEQVAAEFDINLIEED